MIMALIKEDSLVALKLRDQAITNTTPEDSPGNKRKAARLQKKHDLFNLVQRYSDMTIKSFMDNMVAFYNS